jgi:hypothetical protein
MGTRNMPTSITNRMLDHHHHGDASPHPLDEDGCALSDFKDPAIALAQAVGRCPAHAGPNDA